VDYRFLRCVVNEFNFAKDHEICKSKLRVENQLLNEDVMKEVIVILAVIFMMVSCGDGDSNESDSQNIPDEDTVAADTDHSDEAIVDYADTEVDDSSQVEGAAVNFKHMDPTNNSGLEGIDLTFDDQEASSDSQGSAQIVVPEGKCFDVKGVKDGFQDYHFLGVSGDSDFTFYTYVSSRSVTNQVMGMLSQTLDTTKGFIVVGVDYENLSPVYGAEVEVNVDHGDPFIFASSGMPAAGSALEEGGGSFVSFPNTEVGKATIKVIPPEGVTCYPYPAGEGHEIEIDVLEDSVSVIAFSCTE
jgi:hypothetical protein